MMSQNKEESMLQKRTKKEAREIQALLGLVELYLKTGKPIGSTTLQEHGFESLSSATLRNYFAELEKEGYLKQAHSSGGRIPTSKAFQFYAHEMLKEGSNKPEMEEKLQGLKQEETKNIAAYLQKSGEILSQATGYPTFLSSVRFDHDFILDVKFVSIDSSRLICILITSFGQIFTEQLGIDHKLSSFATKRIESYFQWKLKNQEKPSSLTAEEEAISQKIYNEIMVRYLVRYSNYSTEEIYRTGFSKLLVYPEFNDPVSLTSGLSLFENTTQMISLLNECTKGGQLRFWIGEELAPHSICSVLAIPYRINQIPAGSIGILGPSRMDYRELFNILNLFSELLSQTLTKSLYKFKLSFRTPKSDTLYLDKREWPHLIESKEKT